MSSDSFTLLVSLSVGILALQVLVFLLILVNLWRISTVITNTTIAEGENNDDASIKNISDGVQSMLGEFLPKGGASISFRINGMIQSFNTVLENGVFAKQVAEEMRSESRAVRETMARLESGIAKVGQQLDAIALTQARTIDANSRNTTNVITAIESKLGQVAAGTGVDQVIKAGDKVVIDKVKE